MEGQLYIPFIWTIEALILKGDENSKVLEQKGDLLSFKANIDPKSGLMLSCAEPSQARLSWVKLSQAEPSWAKPRIAG